MYRGRSLEPELLSQRRKRTSYTTTNPNVEGNSTEGEPTQMTTGSLKRNYRSKSENRQIRNNTLPLNRVSINQHVNPYDEFPSLRRGMTLEGIMIPEEKVIQERKIRENNHAYAYYFWACSISLFIIATLNLIILLTIMNILGLTLNGMDSMEFLPHNGGVKFLRDLRADNITIGSGIIGGFEDEPLSFTSDEEINLILTKSPKSPRVKLNYEGIHFENVDDFTIIDPETGNIIFDAINQPELTWSHQVENLIVPELTVNRIVSPIGKDLMVQSDSTVQLMGAEGIDIEGRDIKMDAGGDIAFTSESGDIILDAPEIRLDPLSLPVGGGGYPGEQSQLKVCICLPSGQVYTVPEPSNLPHLASGPINKRADCADPKYSPCPN